MENEIKGEKEGVGLCNLLDEKGDREWWGVGGGRRHNGEGRGKGVVMEGVVEGDKEGGRGVD